MTVGQFIEVVTEYHIPDDAEIKYVNFSEITDDSKTSVHVVSYDSKENVLYLDMDDYDTIHIMKSKYSIEIFNDI